MADGGKKKGREKSADATTNEAVGQTEDAAITLLPKLLNNRAAIALLDGLRDAGFRNEQFQPTPNMPLCEKAYIAGWGCEIRNMGQRWDTFEKFWQCSGLRQSYTNVCKRDTVQDWRTEVYQTLVDVGSSNHLIFDTRTFTCWGRNDRPNQ